MGQPLITMAHLQYLELKKYLGKRPQTALRRISADTKHWQNLYKIFIPGPLREYHKVIIEGPTSGSYKILCKTLLRAPLEDRAYLFSDRTSVAFVASLMPTLPQ
jgi:hypothetical protein